MNRKPNNTVVPVPAGTTDYEPLNTPDSVLILTLLLFLDTTLKENWPLWTKATNDDINEETSHQSDLVLLYDCLDQGHSQVIQVRHNQFSYLRQGTLEREDL